MATIDEHVDRIIATKSPELGCRLERRAVDEVLHVLHHRIKGKPELAELLELQPYDFRGTNHLWSEDGVKDYDLARKLSHQTVQTLMRKHSWNFMALIQNVTQPQFWRTPINRWGTTAAGMSGHVYSAHSEAILDLAKNDPRYAEWSDAQWYDFKIARYPDNRAREATHALIQKMMTTYKLDFVNLVKTMRNPPQELIAGWQDAFKTLPVNRYGTTFGGLVDRYNDSPAEAVLDLVAHHSDYAEFRDLKKYDFPDQRNIWNLKSGRKNYELARLAIGTLLAKCGLENETLPELCKKIGDFEFQNEPINRYGTTLRGMLKRVYNSKVTDALNDWFNYGRKDSLV